MSAPRSIPKELVSKFTMDGKAQVYPWWFDDEHKDTSANYNPERVADFREKIRRRGRNHYDKTDAFLYDAFGKHPLTGKRVLIFGSESPWYEVMVQEFGASQIVVVEYNPRANVVPGVTFVKPAELGSAEFDCALSISSFEHDGLGRYGDPLDPYGDFLAMVQAKKNVIFGGIMYLAVPVGRDAVVWNAHRIYGQFRLPMLLAHWELLGSFGFSESDYGKEVDDVAKSSYHQPVFVLRNN